MPASMYAAYGGRFSWTVTALSLALRLLARLMPVSSARPDSGDSSYATRMLLNIFDSMLRLRNRLQYRHICQGLVSSHWPRGCLAKLADRQRRQLIGTSAPGPRPRAGQSE